MKSLIFVTLAAMLTLSCSEKSSYLLRIPDPAAAVSEKGMEPQDLTFTPTVDILFVVDDSGSMSTHQTNLVRNMQLFIDALKQNQELDYHIGVVSTDMRDPERSGRLQGKVPFVTANMSNGLDILRESLRVGTSGSTTELSFEPVRAALTQPLKDVDNRGFYRPDSHLAIFFITDAEDQSNYDVNTYITFLTNLKYGQKEKIVTYGALVPQSSSGCPSDGGAPIRILELIKHFNGLEFSLCDPEFGLKLAGLAEDLARRIGSIIPLNKIPALKTIEVRYGTQIIPEDPINGWQYNPSTISLELGPAFEFDPNQPEGTEIEIRFVPRSEETN